MAVTQYVGARYVPLFADPLDWDNERTYEPLTIVYYQGNSYTSRQYVPTGIDISNDEYWALTGNYNAQIEQYRQEVAAFDGRITSAQEAAEGAQSTADAVTTTVDGITPFDTIPTEGSVKGVTSGGVYSALDGFETEVNSSIDSFKSETNATIEEFKDEVNSDIEGLTGEFDSFKTETNDELARRAELEVLRAPNWTMDGWTRWSVEAGSVNSESRRSVQACQYITDTVAAVYEDEANEGDNVQRLCLRNQQGLIASVAMDLGHTCSMGLDGSDLYIFNVNDSTVYRAQVTSTTLTAPVSLGIPWSGPNWTGTVLDGKIWEATYLDTSPNVRVRNLETGDIEQSYTISYSTDDEFKMMQGASCFKYGENIYVWRLWSSPGYIEIYDPINNEQIYAGFLPELANYVDLGEIEYFSIREDGLFFASQQDSATPSSQMKAGALFRGNIKTGTGTTANGGVIDSGRVYVSITDDIAYAFPHTPTNSTGYGADNPLTFYFLQDINTFLAHYNNECEISVDAQRTDTALVLNCGNGSINYSNHSIVTQITYGAWRMGGITTMVERSTIPAATGATYLITAQIGAKLYVLGSLTSAATGTNFMHLSSASLFTSSANASGRASFITMDSAMIFAADYTSAG